MGEKQAIGQAEASRIGSASVDFDALTISGQEGATALEPLRNVLRLPGRYLPAFDSPTGWEAFGQAFAERTGLVEAWDVYGWPPGCRRMPRLSDESPSFACE